MAGFLAMLPALLASMGTGAAAAGTGAAAAGTGALEALTPEMAATAAPALSQLGLGASDIAGVVPQAAPQGIMGLLGKGAGMMGSAGDFLNKNPMLTMGGMNALGSMGQRPPMQPAPPMQAAPRQPVQTPQFGPPPAAQGQGIAGMMGGMNPQMLQMLMQLLQGRGR